MLLYEVGGVDNLNIRNIALSIGNELIVGVNEAAVRLNLQSLVTSDNLAGKKLRGVTQQLV